ncbi:dihydrofolate reductase-like domain-containing protein [Dissophora ornata]|nr:hypothetical protein BGZ58_009022 [Dissophora ornata]KAI8606216.1 dihydrofolate reductase-like domain-containing protein [Dissophora ornata]
MRPFSIVVAADLANGIGLKGGLPWRLRKDMAFFAKITSKVFYLDDEDADLDQDLPRRVNACIMGRNTWESIPAKFRPLASRFNVIVSRNPHYLDGKPEKNNPLVAVATSFEAALELVRSLQAPPPSEYAYEAAAMAAASILPAPPSFSSDASPITPDIEIQRIFLIGGAQLYEQAVRSKECSHIFMTRIHSTVECDVFFPEIKESDYTLLPSQESHALLEKYLQEPVEGGLIEEGSFKYEYTVYNRI